jgi:hypothetical protein
VESSLSLNQGESICEMGITSLNVGKSPLLLLVWTICMLSDLYALQNFVVSLLNVVLSITYHVFWLIEQSCTIKIVLRSCNPEVHSEKCWGEPAEHVLCKSIETC